MGKKYEPVPNDVRRHLIDLIHHRAPDASPMTIARAAQIAGVYYPTAKAINKVFLREQRTQKKVFRFRLKKVDAHSVVVRNRIRVERLSSSGQCHDVLRICGVKLQPRKDAFCEAKIKEEEPSTRKSVESVETRSVSVIRERTRE